MENHTPRVDIGARVLSPLHYSWVIPYWLDLILTLYGINVIGLREGNPIVASLSTSGFILFKLTGTLLVFAFLKALPTRYSELASRVFSTVFWFIVVWNFMLIVTYPVV